MTSLPQPRLEHVARVSVELDEPVELGATRWGTRRVIGIAGGSVSGPDIQGKVLRGGADWQTVHDDGTASIEARYILELTDDALVQVTAAGIRTGPAAVLDRLRRGETVDPAEYYFRTSVRLETSSSIYDWLNTHLFVGIGARFADSVEFDLCVVR